MHESEDANASHAPVRRAKVLHLRTSVDLSGIDPSQWTLENLGPTKTLEQLEAEARRPAVRLRRLARAPKWVMEERLAQRRSRRQRRVRGWTDADLWNLDAYLCRRLGAMLAAQVDEIRNHPPELEYDAWRTQVRGAGEALLAYDPDDADRVAEARTALRWVADNLVDLWD
ncbi:hypothetical protein [Nocardioides zhouii]|uniref:Uncharacterized protein n=1 Tax=Nocardioides zhouii TaxID=1168729 RepID=A0A4Q2SXY9_9ACTN|nr:hypothetical protein [Nocardioides zhouii]RYC10493.1 hypothetical protein EUA94_13285 [Nocardioides zhouii]